MRDGVYLDANLLVLLVAGLTGQAVIARHRRLQGYTVEDYGVLFGLVEQAGQVFVTPNTLTEASNLLAQHGEPERSELLRTLRSLVDKSPETVVASKNAAGRHMFVALGLTDAVLLEAVSSQRPLLTVDLDLYGAALEGGEQAAINFHHYRFADA